MALFRDGLLTGRGVVLAGGDCSVIADALTSLGAQVERLAEWEHERSPVQAIVFDARSAFGSGGQDALATALAAAWSAVREVATGALIEGRQPGKVVLLAPTTDAGPMAEAARAGLENLARTLSVEWARYQITVIAIAPGSDTDEQRLAEMVAFLCSGAAEYLSGCRLELGALPASGAATAQASSTG